jgi:hypothetical protein
MALDTNLNQSPYYDDYDESKNFHRVLFRPGFAVQARELSQTQSILQNQIERFGNHIFAEGAIVTGCPKTRTEVNFIKILDDDTTGFPVDVKSKEGLSFTAGTTGMKGIVRKVLDGSQVSADKKTLYVAYTNSGTTGGTAVVGPEEVLTFSDGTTAVVVNSEDTPTGKGIVFRLGDGIIYAKGHFIRHHDQSIVAGRYTTLPSVKIGFGIREELIGSETDATLLDPAQGASNFSAPGADRLKLSTYLRITPISESIVVSTNTEDNNGGGANAVAPDPEPIAPLEEATTVIEPTTTIDEETREEVVVSPPQIETTGEPTDTTGFTELITIDQGTEAAVAEQKDYNILGDAIATNVSEINGDFNIRPFMINIKEHLKGDDNQGLYTAEKGGLSTKLGIGIEGGVGYVQGFRFEFEQKASIYRDVDKGVDTELFEQQSVASNYGQYLMIRDAAGVFDSTLLPIVSLRNAEGDAITNGTYDLTGAPGSEIGTAVLRNFVYDDNDSDQPSGEFRAYLQDIKMTSGSIQDVRSVFIANAGGVGKNAIGDVVLENGVASIKEPSFTSLIFSFPYEAVKTVRDDTNNVETSFTFKKGFDVNIDQNGRVQNISTGDASQIYTTTGALNDTQKDRLFTVVATSTGYSTMSGSVSGSSGTDQLVGSGTDFNKLKPFTLIRLDGTDVYQIESIQDATHLTLTNNLTSTYSSDSIDKIISSGEIIDMSEEGLTGTRSISINSSTSAEIDIEENLTAGITARVIINLSKINARETNKLLRTSYVIINPNTHSAGTNGPWSLGFSDVFSIEGIWQSTNFNVTPSESDTDVKSRYLLDNGQRAGFYQNGSISTVVGGSAPTGQLLVKLKFFQPDYSQGAGYFSVDSYPINDNLISDTTIKTYEIPLFQDPTSGNRINLRNSIDIRPVKENSATISATIGSASTNPTSATTYNVSPEGQFLSNPNEVFSADLVAYFGRIDKLLIDSGGQIVVKRGVPSTDPTEPLDNENMMTIASIDIPPYPSISPFVGKNISRQDLQVVAKVFNTRRYTMKDIGELDQRIRGLEYYTSLSLLERSASDLTIQDAEGNTRFKNGILVDPFTGHNVGDVTNPDYKIAIDADRKEGRPTFKLRNIDFIHDEDSSSNTTRRCRDFLLRITNASNAAGNKFGETITGATSGASGSLFYVTAEDNNVSILVESVEGEFSVGETITGGVSGITATITEIRRPEPGPLITLDYLHSDLIQQQVASTAFRISDAEFFDFIGELTLTPDGDQWVDTTTKPDLQVNQQGNYDNWEVLSNAWGTSWNSWQTNFSGQLSSKTTRLRDSSYTKKEGNYNNTYNQKNYTTKRVFGKKQSRTGFKLEAVPEVNKTHLGAKVVDMNVIPYMRSKLIYVEGEKLRPNTRLYVYFDGEDVTQYCRPVVKEVTRTRWIRSWLYRRFKRRYTYRVTGAYGAEIVTDDNGRCKFEYFLPNNSSLKFRVGTKPLRVTDVADNGTDNTTAAEALYSASGMHQTKQETVISTRNANFQKVDVKDSRTVVTSVTNTKTNTKTRNLISSKYVPPPCRRGCFLAGTLITMEDGTKVPVELIKLGDRVKLGGGVFALGQFWNTDLYEYRGIKVAGSHMVKHDGEWIRVRDIPQSEKVDVGKGVVVYVFGCENRRIDINGIEFTDYFEVVEQEAVKQMGEVYFDKWEEFADEQEKGNEKILERV